MSKNDSIILPPYFTECKQTVPEDGGFMAGAKIYTYSTAYAESMVSPCVVSPEISMSFGDVQPLIDYLHANIGEREGIIEVKSGITESGLRYVYRITKRGREFVGMDYTLGMNLEMGNKIWFIDGVFGEAGMTGIRDNTVAASIFQKITGKTLSDPDNGWFTDPYDPTFAKGLRMNFSEKPDFDNMFPNHPLSELRKFVQFILDNNKPEEKKKMALDIRKISGQIDLTAIKDKAKDGLDKVDWEGVKDKAAVVGTKLTEKAGEAKDLAVKTKDDIEEKLTELDRMLSESITEYNDAFTQMNDKGVRLYVERCRATDTIENIQNLINSIANHPKSFDTDFEEIKAERAKFIDSCEFAEREIQAARTAAADAGAGLAAGSTVAFMAPTAAMWIATTFGTASTGTAISALSGAAATNAALAWLGGGTLAAGGGGMAAGNAFLALAGPIGWSIAGATLLTSIILFAKKRAKLNKQKNEEIEAVKKNIEKVRESDAQINALLSETAGLRDNLNQAYGKSLSCFGQDYLGLSGDQKAAVGALVNNTKALSALFAKTVE